MGGYDRQILTEASTSQSALKRNIEKFPINSVSCPDYFWHAQRNKVWSMAYSVFDPSATMVALQSHCFMQITSRTAITNFKKARRFKRYQETKPGRTKKPLAKECQDFCERQCAFLSLTTGIVKFPSFKCR